VVERGHGERLLVEERLAFTVHNNFVAFGLGGSGLAGAGFAYQTRHAPPQGKVEAGVREVCAQNNGVAEQNLFLAERERTVADIRIHGTTRQQVGKLLAAAEQPANVVQLQFLETHPLIRPLDAYRIPLPTTPQPNQMPWLKSKPPSANFASPVWPRACPCDCRRPPPPGSLEGQTACNWQKEIESASFTARF